MSESFFDYQPNRQDMDRIGQGIDELTQGLNSDDLQALLLKKFVESAEKANAEGVGVSPEISDLLADISRVLTNTQEAAQGAHEAAEAAQVHPTPEWDALENNVPDSSTTPAYSDPEQTQRISASLIAGLDTGNQESTPEKHDDFGELLETVSQKIEGIAVCGKFPKGVDIPAVNARTSGVYKKADGGRHDVEVSSTKGAANRSTRGLYDMVSTVQEQYRNSTINPFITLLASPDREKGLIIYSTPVTTRDTFQRAVRLMVTTATLPLDDARKLLSAIETNPEQNGERFIQRVFKGLSGLEDRTGGTLRTIDEDSFSAMNASWGEVKQQREEIKEAQKIRDNTRGAAALEKQNQILGTLIQALQAGGTKSA